jgi:hypothetical protein
VLQLDEVPKTNRLVAACPRPIHSRAISTFLSAWDERGERTITPERIDAARALFAGSGRTAARHSSEADAALERTRLFGSAISVGIVDVVLGLEASRPLTSSIAGWSTAWRAGFH